MFVKKIIDFFIPGENQEDKHNYIQYYRATVNAYNKFEDEEEFQELFKRSKVYFEKEDDF